MGEEPVGLRSARSLHQSRERRLTEQFGGFSWGADFIGFAVAIFFTLVFLGIVGAIVGTVGYQMGAQVPKLGGSLSGTTQKLGIGGLIGSLVAVFLAYLIGGYTAGRMARFDGVKNGLGVVIWTIIAAIVLGILGAILGSSYNVPNQLHLKIDRTTLTAAGVISLIVTLVVMTIASALGGVLGINHHKRIDREIQGSDNAGF